MKTPVEFAGQYIAIRNETDAARRRKRLDGGEYSVLLPAGKQRLWLPC
jgi:hypothetical protein